MTTIHIFDVTEDETGSWLDDPRDSGETTTMSEWCAMVDTETTHFDTHIAWERDGEFTTVFPGELAVQDYGWKETDIALRCTFAEAAK